MPEEYTVTCTGEIHDGTNSVEVSKKIQKRFSVTVEIADSLLSGKTSFKKNNLNKITALQYHQVLNNLGLITKIQASDSVTRQKNNNIQQTKIDQTSIIAKEDNTKNSISSSTLTITKNSGKSLGKFIRYGALIFIGSVIADEFLRDVVYLDTYGFNLGHLSYAIGYILMAIGTYSFARENNYKLPTRALSLLSFVGLAVLLLIKSPDKTQTPLNVKILAVFVLFFTAYWSLQISNNQQSLKFLMEFSHNLNNGRSIYPSKDAYIDTITFDNEIIELKDYIVMAFDLLSNHDLSIENELSISNSIYYETTKLFMWVRYQDLLHTTQDRRNSYTLNQSHIDASRQELINLIETNMAMDLSQRVKNVHSQWFFANNTFDQKLNERKKHIHSSLIKYQIKLTEKKYFDNTPYTNTSLKQAMDTHDIPFESDIHYSIDNQIINIKIPKGYINNDKALTLLMAYYISNGNYRNNSAVILNQVGGDYPNNNLGTNLWILNKKQ